jgi:hypothetical protein
MNTLLLLSCDILTFTKLAFNTSLTEWNATFTSPSRQNCWEWCTDACSSSPDHWDPPGDARINWKPACARHDFSYRNLKRLGQFNRKTKLAADEHLRDGMVELCAEHKACKVAVRDVYYMVVRQFQKDEAEHNKWDEKEGKGNLNCSVFPGCCADHASGEKCGVEKMGGQFRGDGSCIAR